MSNSTSLSKNADEVLIESLRQQGPTKRKSEEHLFSAYIYFIREGMLKFNLTEDESFDAYSDTVLSAFDEIQAGSFQGRSTLKTWLYQIFHNKCVDLVRKKSTNKRSIHKTLSLTEGLAHLSDTSKSIVQKLIEKADWEHLKQKLTELGDTCRRLLGLSADGYSDKEISTIMEYKTADVVKTSRLRCLEKLRQLYKPS